MWKIPDGDCKTFQGHGCTAGVGRIMPDGNLHFRIFLMCLKNILLLTIDDYYFITLICYQKLYCNWTWNFCNIYYDDIMSPDVYKNILLLSVFISWH